MAAAEVGFAAPHGKAEVAVHPTVVDWPTVAPERVVVSVSSGENVAVVPDWPPVETWPLKYALVDPTVTTASVANTAVTPTR